MWLEGQHSFHTSVAADHILLALVACSVQLRRFPVGLHSEEGD